MEFDKTRIFTSLNADEVKIGSKGFVSDFYDCLKDYVESNDFYKSKIGVLECNNKIFKLKNHKDTYQLFYLVEEPKEPKKRPCNREELIALLKKQGISMLLRKDNNTVYNFMYLKSESLTVVSPQSQRYIHYTYEDLCERFTLLDGTSLWVEE